MSPEPQIEPLAYDLKQASKAINVSQMTLRRLIRRGEIVHRRIGTKILIPRDSLEIFLRKSHATGHHRKRE